MEPCSQLLFSPSCVAHLYSFITCVNEKEFLHLFLAYGIGKHLYSSVERQKPTAADLEILMISKSKVRS